jgi:RNA polymerase sigma-70 factor (ECF subfamily)
LKTVVPLGGDEDNELVSADPTPEGILLAKMDQRTVREALEDLPIHFREVLLLCEVEEMSYEEIAQTVGIPIGTVMSRLSRARKALRGKLVARFEGVRNAM